MKKQNLLFIYHIKFIYIKNLKKTALFGQSFLMSEKRDFLPVVVFVTTPFRPLPFAVSDIVSDTQKKLHIMDFFLTA